LLLAPRLNSAFSSEGLPGPDPGRAPVHVKKPVRVKKTCRSQRLRIAPISPPPTTSADVP
jgi:hypothetical protein